jgi:hypothetical protein
VSSSNVPHRRTAAPLRTRNGRIVPGNDTCWGRSAKDPVQLSPVRPRNGSSWSSGACSHALNGYISSDTHAAMLERHLFRRKWDPLQHGCECESGGGGLHPDYSHDTKGDTGHVRRKPWSRPIRARNTRRRRRAQRGAGGPTHSDTDIPPKPRFSGLRIRFAGAHGPCRPRPFMNNLGSDPPDPKGPPEPQGPCAARQVPFSDDEIAFEPSYQSFLA